MRKPKRSEFTEEDGTFDEDGFDDVMGTYEDTAYDEERDRQMEDKEEKEHYADYSDQG